MWLGVMKRMWTDSGGLCSNVKDGLGLGWGRVCHTCGINALAAVVLRPWLQLASPRDSTIQLQHWASKTKRSAFSSWACDRISPVSASIFVWPSPCYSPLLFLLRTCVIGFKAQLNPGCSHLKILHLIISAKTFSPNKVTFTGL